MVSPPSSPPPFLSMWWVPALLLALFLHAADALISPPQALNASFGRSSFLHPLTIKEPLTLWCSTDGIKSAKFVHLSKDKKTHEAKVNGNNATLTIDVPTVLHSGDYRCEMETKNGLKTETTSVYVRGIVHTEHPEEWKQDDPTKPNFTLGDVVLTEGGSFNLTCPIFSHPLPKINWKKGNTLIELSSRISVIGDRLTITDVNFDDAGEYTCEALNQYTVDKTRTMIPRLSVTRKVNIKSQYAWIWPLAVIIATLILLVVIIWACDIRKKKREKRETTYLATDRE